MRQQRWIRILTMVFALALLATACGGDDGESSATTTTTTSAAAGGDGGEGDASSNDTTTTTGAAPVSGDSGSSWCDQVRRASEEDSPVDLNFLTASPAEIRASFEVLLGFFEDAAEIAPDEIDGDVDMVLAAYRLFVDKGNSANWDLFALAEDQEFISSFEDPALEEAANRIDAYNRDVCGVDFTTFMESETGDAPPETVSDDPVEILLNSFGLPVDLFPAEAIECMREELGAEFEAKVTPDYVPSTEDIELLIAAVDACGIDIG